MYHIYQCNVRTGLTLNALALNVFAVYGDGETGPDLLCPLYGDPPLMAAVSWSSSSWLSYSHDGLTRPLPLMSLVLPGQTWLVARLSETGC